MRRILYSLIISACKWSMILLLDDYPLRIIILEEIVPALLRNGILLFFDRKILSRHRTDDEYEYQEEQQEFCRQIECVPYSELKLYRI